ncbi:MAG TPA: hypothetical protein VK021_13835 [Flavobacteriaceae bacterium]|nr:hypothetical protein [Flavobacteriaceae bacterium]
MKYFIYTLLILSVAMLIFNAFHIDFNNILSQESSGALIGILSSLCVIVLMFILIVSRKIKQKNTP